MKAPKPDPRVEDQAYLDHIRAMPCCICLAEGRVQTDPTEPEHLKTRGARGSDRGNTVPTCAYHREMRHKTMGIKSFTAYCSSLKLDLWALAARLGRNYQQFLET